MKHKHCELIKAWADGAEIQEKIYFQWWDRTNPDWDNESVFRIKPEPKPDVVTYLICDVTGAWVEYGIHHMFPNHKGVIKVISDGQTGKPKSAEVLK